MANKEKDSERLTETTTPVKKELNAETLKASAQEKIEYHNKLVTERERLIGETNKVTEAMAIARGEFNNIQNLLDSYFATEVPSDNGSA